MASLAGYYAAPGANHPLAARTDLFTHTALNFHIDTSLSACTHGALSKAGAKEGRVRKWFDLNLLRITIGSLHGVR